MPFGIVCAACFQDKPEGLHYLPEKAPDCVCRKCRDALVAGTTLEELGRPHWDAQIALDRKNEGLLQDADRDELDRFWEVLEAYNGKRNEGTPSDVLESRRVLQMAVGAELLKRRTPA